MSDRFRIYVAGPISKGDLRHNVQQARDAGGQLLKAGFAPFVPHLSCYWAGDTPEVLPSGTTHEDWLGMDLPWVAVSDAVLRLPGESKGADAEVALARQLGIPVYHEVLSLIENPPARGEPQFEALLREMLHLHRQKARDYGSGLDPFANVRASSAWGIPPWLGALLRLNDKVVRLQTFAKTGVLANEGAEDSMIDIACYAIIALVLLRESRPDQAAGGRGD